MASEKEDRDFGRGLVTILLAIAAISCVALPAWYLLSNEGATLPPIVQLMLDVLATGFALAVGIRIDMSNAEKRASRVWLKQAEGVIDRLVNLRATVVTMRAEAAVACDTVEGLLPGLTAGTVATSPVYVWAKTDCNHRTEKLNIMLREVDSSINDWARFIRNNCTENECYRINKQIAGARGEKLPDPPWERPGLSPSKQERIRRECC